MSDSRYEELMAKFGGLQSQVTSLAATVREQYGKAIDDLEARVDALEADGAVRTRLDTIEGAGNELLHRVNILEEKVGTK